MSGKKPDEQSIRLLGFQCVGSFMRARGDEPPSAVAVTQVDAGRLLGKSRRSAQRDFAADVEKQGALSRLALLIRGWREILPGDQLRDLAMRLLDAHELRTADSLQLAAALIWCQQRPARRTLV